MFLAKDGKKGVLPRLVRECFKRDYNGDYFRDGGFSVNSVVNSCKNMQKMQKKQHFCTFLKGCLIF